MVKRESYSLQSDESWKTMCVWLQDAALLVRAIGEKNYTSQWRAAYIHIQKWALFINFEKSGTHSENAVDKYVNPLSLSLSLWIILLRGCQTKKTFPGSHWKWKNNASEWICRRKMALRYQSAIKKGRSSCARRRRHHLNVFCVMPGRSLGTQSHLSSRLNGPIIIKGARPF